MTEGKELVLVEFSLWKARADKTAFSPTVMSPEGKCWLQSSLSRTAHLIGRYDTKPPIGKQSEGCPGGGDAH